MKINGPGTIPAANTIANDNNDHSNPRVTALMVASSLGLIEVVQRLLDEGANPRQLNQAGFNALDFAQFFGHHDIADLLLTRGAQPTSASPSDLAQSLSSATINTLDQSVKLELLQAGAPPDMAVDTKGRTALMEAAGFDDSLEELQALLHFGANPNLQREDNGETAVHVAAKRMNVPGLKALIAAGGNLDVKNHKGQTPLLKALYFSNEEAEEVCTFLLDQGADPKVSDRDGNSLLHLAVGRGSLELVKRAVCPETVNQPNSKGLTPLLAAFDDAEHDDEKASPMELGDFLISQGADIRHRDNQGRTILHLAASSCWLEVVRWALAHGFDVNTPDHSGMTPLMVAARATWSGGMDTLLERGASVNGTDHQGRTALFFVGTVGLARWFDPVAVQPLATLVSNGANIHHCDHEGNNPLLFFLSGEHPRVFPARALILMGVDVLGKNQAADTPFFRAWSLLEKDPNEAHKSLCRMMVLALSARSEPKPTIRELFPFLSPESFVKVDDITARLLLDLVADPERLPSTWQTAAKNADPGELETYKREFAKGLFGSDSGKWIEDLRGQCVIS